MRKLKRWLWDCLGICFHDYRLRVYMGQSNIGYFECIQCSTHRPGSRP